MPDAGRPAASEGNAYHDVTTALRLVEMIRHGRFDYVWPEAQAHVDDIKIRYDDGRERYEQVKERAPGRSGWTPATLDGEGVLGQFVAQHRQTPDAELVLVTASDARPLRRLCEAAATANGNYPDCIADALAAWREHLGDGGQSQAHEIGRRAGIDDEELLGLLSRIRVEDNQGRLDNRRDGLAALLTSLVDLPHRAATALEGLAREASISRQMLRRGDAEGAIAAAGAGPRLGEWAFRVDLAAYADTIVGLVLQRRLLTI